MGFLKRMMGGGADEQGPEWARPMNAADAAAFLETVGSELERRGLSFAVGEGMVRVERQGRSSDYGLTNLAQVCHLRGRGEWTATVSSHFDNLFAAEDANAAIERQGADLEAVRSMLKVRLMPGASLGGMDAHPPVSWEYAPGIVATLVYDLPTTVSSVNVAHIESWGRSRQELLDVALANVRQDAVESQPMTDGGGRSAVVACVADHFFAASHAFLLGERLPPEARSQAVFAVPHRHALLYAPMVDLGVVQSINQLIPIATSLFNQGPGSISPGIYWWREGVVTHLPAEFDGKAVQFAPPDDFVQALNSLAAPS